MGPGIGLQPVRGPSGTYEIGESMGARAGANLFHSFLDFTIGAGDTALFTSNLPTENVITRVTGGPSSIYGTIRSTIPGASLFFLNPAGIFFGASGAVDVQGSFHASTADVLRMKDRDGQELIAFSKDSLLKMATPSAFGFLSDHPAPLTVSGSRISVGNGAQISMTGGGIEIRGGKLVATGGSIGLASVASAGDVTFSGRGLATDGIASLGDIQITGKSSVRVDDYSNGAGVVSIRGGRFVLDNSSISADVVDGRGASIDIQVRNEAVLSNGATVGSMTSGDACAASIVLSAGTVEISNLSRIESTTEGSGKSSDITVTAGKSISISNQDPEGNQYLTGIHSDVTIGARGSGGQIIVSTPALSLDRGVISAETIGFGPDFATLGRPGDIRIETNRLQMSNTALITNRSTTFDLSAAPAAPHEISIRPREAAQPSSISLTGLGTNIQSTAMLSTQGGASITLEATDISLSNGAGVSTTVYGGTGNAGAIGITADRVSISGGSRVTSEALNTYSSSPYSVAGGNSGQISVGAKDSLSVDGGGLFTVYGMTSYQSSGFSTSTSGRGNGGTISINAGTIRVQNGGAITSEARTGSTGAAGQVVIGATKSLTVSGSNDFELSNISTSAFGAGAAGDVRLSAPLLEIGNEAFVGSFTAGPGKGGSVRIGRAADLPIDTTDLSMRDGGLIAVTSVKDSKHPGGGAAGSVDINVGRLTLQNGSQILANTAGGSDGAGGSITIRASDSVTLTGRDPANPQWVSMLQASTSGQGAAGNITVHTPALTIADGARVVAASNSADPRAGAAGSIYIGTAAEPVGNLTLAGGEISVFAVQGPASGEPREGNIHIAANGLVMLEKSSSVTASVQNGLGGDISVSGPNHMVMRDGSRVLATTEIGTGGRIDIGSEVFIPSADSVVSADAGVGEAGTVTIEAPQVDLQGGLTAPPVNYFDASALLRPLCAARKASAENEHFVVTHRRVLPLSEEGLLVTFATSETGSAAGDSAAQSDAARRLGQIQLRRGEYAEASKTLNEALAWAEKAGDNARIAATLDSLANARLALGESRVSGEALNRAMPLAESLGDSRLLASLQNSSGNLRASREGWGGAVYDYKKSADLAHKSGDASIEAKALANAARAAIEGSLPEARELLERAASRLKTGDPADANRLRIHVAASYEQMAQAGGPQQGTNLLAAYGLLTAVLPVARQTGDGRALSAALGHLGTLYQMEGRFGEALYFVREGLRTAESNDASDLVYRWRWREGQILWALGHTSAAVESFDRAVKILEETRQDALVRYGAAGTYFRRRIAPVYLDLVNSLLKSSDLVRGAGAHDLLLEARATVERLKAAEVRNFFQDECADYLRSHTEDLDSIKGRVAVVYPIVLPDRLELLVTLPSGLERHSVPMGEQAIKELANEFLSALQRHGADDAEEYRRPAQELYRQLVAPYEESMRRQQVDTIVFVPDGSLRTIPIAALHDGNAFLVERYGVAVIPGLQLVDPRPFPREGVKAIVAGLSESVKGRKALGAVTAELDEVRKLYTVRPLLNEEFTGNRLEREMSQSEPSLVHIASHAQFTGDPATSWILAYDGEISIGRFSEMVGVTKYRESPVELLVLSACETAAGDERAALGLSGVALRAGARSALGSLWAVADPAAARLIPGFYRELQKPGVSRAMALSLAQRELLWNIPEFRHPYFWSPFLVIGGWF
ncbi:MAG: CHAT domain-containing protein [Acidobacteria bacterium]|nr:CHAT domain-containing protein [Acidobacteriota bacterium]